MKNQLRALRERHSWTQAMLADRLGVSRQTINALETGRYDPSLPLAFRIAATFDQPIEAIFFPDESSTRATTRPATRSVQNECAEADD